MTKPWTGIAIAVAAALAVTGLAAITYHETRSVERDRHAVLKRCRDIERALQKHRASSGELFLSVEGQHGPGERDAEREAGHQDLLRDFERLAHLDGFAMSDLTVEVAGDLAVARYRVQGRPSDPGTTAPVSGEMRFERAAGSWHVTGLTLVERR